MRFSNSYFKKFGRISENFDIENIRDYDPDQLFLPGIERADEIKALTIIKQLSILEDKFWEEFNDNITVRRIDDFEVPDGVIDNNRLENEAEMYVDNLEEISEEYFNDLDDDDKGKAIEDFLKQDILTLTNDSEKKWYYNIIIENLMVTHKDKDARAKITELIFPGMEDELKRVFPGAFKSDQFFSDVENPDWQDISRVFSNYPNLAGQLYKNEIFKNLVLNSDVSGELFKYLIGEVIPQYNVDDELIDYQGFLKAYGSEFFDWYRDDVDDSDLIDWYVRNNRDSLYESIYESEHENVRSETPRKINTLLDTLSKGSEISLKDIFEVDEFFNNTDDYWFVTWYNEQDTWVTDLSPIVGKMFDIINSASPDVVGALDSFKIPIGTHEQAAMYKNVIDEVEKLLNRHVTLKEYLENKEQIDKQVQDIKAVMESKKEELEQKRKEREQSKEKFRSDVSKSVPIAKDSNQQLLINIIQKLKNKGDIDK